MLNIDRSPATFQVRIDNFTPGFIFPLHFQIDIYPYADPFGYSNETILNVET